MSGIVGSIDILKYAPLSGEYGKLIDIAKNCAINLMQVINDILDFSKVRNGLTAKIDRTRDTRQK